MPRTAMTGLLPMSSDSRTACEADRVDGQGKSGQIRRSPSLKWLYKSLSRTVTEAGVDPNVSALVYVAARAPDAGEDYTALAERFPTPPGPLLHMPRPRRAG
jgi:hypothetical protein